MQPIESPLELARAELHRSKTLSDYEAVDVAWVAMIKAANTRSETAEHNRLVALLQQASIELAKEVVLSPAVDVLLSLEPSLESVLTSGHERLDRDRTARELNEVRTLRDLDPKRAVLSLAEVLKRIRNRRAHGFKTPFGPRDQQILSAAAPIMRAMAEAAIKTADA